jgi:hypothetical protein
MRRIVVACAGMRGWCGGWLVGKIVLFSGHFWGVCRLGVDFEIRRGHQVRLRVAVEGPAARARSGLQRLAPHPLLRRDTIAYCIERRAPPLGDSLWIVPTRSSGNVERWRRMNNVPVSADVAASPEAWQRPAWALPCLVEVREGSPDGPCDR